MENIIVENKEKFIKVTSAKGYVITKWKDGNDIKEYASSKEMYFPLNYDLSEYYAITDEKDSEYKAAQEKAYKDEEEARIKELAVK